MDYNSLVASIFRDIERLHTVNRPRRRRRKNNRKKTKAIRGFTYDAVEFPLNHMNNDLYLGLSTYDDLVKSKFFKHLTEQGLSVHHKHFSVIASKKDWETFVVNYIDPDDTIISTSSNECVVVCRSNYMIGFDIQSSKISINLFGSESKIIDFYDAAVKRFEEVLNEIEWIYSADGQSIDVPLRNDRKPLKEMYPFLGGETLESYYDRYMASSASILLLIGPPGTGKTTFIRGLLQHTQSSAVVTYDANILEKDYVFAHFIEGDKNVMVLEDADMFLKARSEGNTMMHKFLNVGDGLVSTMNKKMIFSTNLPSIRDIDPALIRPGRCFDIIKFEPLTADQSKILADKVGVDLTDSDSHSVAEIFHKKIEVVTKTQKIGFI